VVIIIIIIITMRGL